ncbi:transcription factor IIIB 60 kDa subunit-like isoform X1 [Zingiber officinale]|uniref:transcription factor IIIB 60 kDa subunit-like isoform X1 n=1 Tax=Zingiber officinale TaxID=94328 RepID=UPI001C4C0879|nr:transcription factor IIIB 60 kDa subunit-like isoform X1 [Zingiber officinale]
MGWCSHCDDECPIFRDPDNGYVCCALCGRILDQDIYYTGPTFAKDSSGQSQLTGNLMKILQHELSGSYERTLKRGKDEISYIVSGLDISGGDPLIDNAHVFYQLAVDKNFTKGRRLPYVAAACLYLACRQRKMAYLLIDFSDYLQISVYVLGAVFLQLCKTLKLLEHPIVQNIVDPSLFINRFTERLLGRKNNAVSDTALRLVASMKRDWMQTGRKPNGLCGAALYISVHSHGLNYSKSDIGSVVHICEATLTRRLLEFESTESGSLTMEEFLFRAEDVDGESPSIQLPKPGKLLCQHKETDAPHFAHGLCKECYDEFIEISGGLQGGTDPPAFQRAEKQRMEKIKLPDESNLDNQETNEKHINIPNEGSCDVNSTSYVSPVEGKPSKELRSADPAGHESIDPSTFSEQYGFSDSENDGSDHFSDIDDAEVNGYLHTEKEKELKKIIWEEMNKEYLEEQAAKEAAAAAAKEAYEAMYANASEDLLAAKELVEATDAALVKSKKEKKQRRIAEVKNMIPARTPLEAVRRMLMKKTFSAKVNYEALETMFSSEQNHAKKQKVELDVGDPHETLDKKDDHADILDNKDDDGPGASDNDNYDVNYDDYKGGNDEYDYGDEDHDYEDF